MLDECPTFRKRKDLDKRIFAVLTGKPRVYWDKETLRPPRFGIKDFLDKQKGCLELLRNNFCEELSYKYVARHRCLAAGPVAAKLEEDKRYSKEIKDSERF